MQKYFKLQHIICWTTKNYNVSPKNQALLTKNKLWKMIGCVSKGLNCIDKCSFLW